MNYDSGSGRAQHLRPVDNSGYLKKFLRGVAYAQKLKQRLSCIFLCLGVLQ